MTKQSKSSNEPFELISDLAIVYPGHNSQAKRFVKTFTSLIQADVFKIRLYPPSSKKSLRDYIHNSIKRRTRSFTKRINILTTCDIDIDRYKAVILIGVKEGNHLQTECLSFLNSFYQIFIHSPSKLLVMGIGKHQKLFTSDIGRIQSLFTTYDVPQYIPLFNLDISFVFFYLFISFILNEIINTNQLFLL